jgi:4-hydroxybenzoate polyprenyltransferase
VTPFFAILLYFRNIDLIIIAYALFLFFILLLKDITKDLKNLKGDFSQDYQTIPVVFGEGFTKAIISLIAFINIFLLFNLYLNFSQGFMTIFFSVSLILLLVFLIKLILSKKVSDYLLLHNILRFVIAFGVFSIIFLAF